MFAVTEHLIDIEIVHFHIEMQKKYSKVDDILIALKNWFVIEVFDQ